ncbi:MAG: cation-translocating P-type ATPase family protein [Verrucomicrobia bacterium]|nr:cation-translocating P-type ATPase family protein [Verrucomicrobiota bacterium]
MPTPWKQLGKPLFIAGIGALLALYWLGWIKNVGLFDIAVLIALVGGYKIFGDAVWGLLHGKISSDLAIAIAACAALAIGQYFAAAEVIFIMLVGGWLEELAVDRTRGAIEKLIRLVPRSAHVRRGDEIVEVAITDIRPGDVVVVRPGERIAVDGEVTEGSSSVDQSAITGESIPASKAGGDKVFAGTINQVGSLDVRVTAVGEDSTLGKIIHLVEEAEEKKAAVHQRADRWAVWFVPAVLALGLATFFFSSGDFNARLIRAVSVLIVACPCALVLATPTGIAAGIGRLARAGVLVKGGVYLEHLARVRAVVFDKTGTLTAGKPRVVEVVAFAGDEREMFALAATAESHSEHPLAHVIVAEAKRRGITLGRAERFEAAPGLGMVAECNGSRVTIGNRQLLQQRSIAIPAEAEARITRLEEVGYTVVLVATNGAVAGAIAVMDTPRDDAKDTVAQLRALGIEHVLLLTGDNERVGRAVGERVGISEVGAGLLPADKVSRIRALQQRGLPTVMCGDGINDAPSLAAADVGVALHGLGADITLEAADVVLMSDDLKKIPFAIEFCRRVVATIHRNIWWFAIGFNGSAVFAASQGWIGPIGAAITHQIASLLVVCNSLRLLWSGEWAAKLAVAWKREAEEMKQFGASVTKLCREHPRGARSTAAAVVVIGWLATGLTVIQPDEVGVWLHFGKKQAVLGPGLHCVWPWPCDEVPRVLPGRVQRVQVGLRSVEPAAAKPWWETWTKPAQTGVSAPPEPTAYEWNYEHKGGFQFVPEEATTVVGDENLVAVTMAIHFVDKDPVAYLFATVDPPSLVKALAEAALRDAAGRATAEAMLTTGRAATERTVMEYLQKRLDECGAGIEVQSVRLQDVHPPIELVDAYRDVASAVEEKSRVINEAEGYRNEQLPLARGTATNTVLAATAARDAKIADSTGKSERFAVTVKPLGAQRAAHAERLYLELMEEILPSQQLYVVDRRGKGQIYLLNDRLKALLGPAAQSAPAPARPTIPEE